MINSGLPASIRSNRAWTLSVVRVCHLCLLSVGGDTYIPASSISQLVDGDAATEDADKGALTAERIAQTCGVLYSVATK